ncbi:condensation domain-containing protein, partial [Mesorhizobium mediterraneum]|uniref:condensation domain-containing protein n=1 Tax=Mesorhizobium mediterraneum TaxID=43617 RepID=UPI001AEDBA7A
MRLAGLIDERRLHDAIRRVVARHQILRSTFCLVAGLDYPLQQINDQPSPELVDISLQRHSPSDHTLCVAVSPLCADVASLGVLVRELRAVYNGAQGQEEPLQYIQFAEWMNELTNEEGADEARRFWTQRETAPVAPELPEERPAGAAGMSRLEGSI